VIDISHCQACDEEMIYLANNTKDLLSLDVDGNSYLTDELVYYIV